MAFDVSSEESSSGNMGSIVDQGLEHHFEIGTDGKGYHQGTYISQSHEVTLDLRMERNIVIAFHGEFCME